MGQSVSQLNERASNVAATALEDHQKFNNHFWGLQTQRLFGGEPVKTGP